MNQKICHGEMPKRDWPNLRREFSQRWRRLTEPRSDAANSDTRVCTKCCSEKKLDAFYTNPKDETRRLLRCKECMRKAGNEDYERDPEKFKIRAEDWQDKNPEATRDIKRRAELKFKYGMTLEEFRSWIVNQKGLCGICKQPMKSPHVDHDHKTGKVRGLLCPFCNWGLGHFKDEIAHLEAAIIYLKGAQ